MKLKKKSEEIKEVLAVSNAVSNSTDELEPINEDNLSKLPENGENKVKYLSLLLIHNFFQNLLNKCYTYVKYFCQKYSLLSFLYSIINKK